MKVIYRKLVRVKIPNICLFNNQTPKYKVLDENESINQH